MLPGLLILQGSRMSADYKTPIKKLASFFEKSRNNWKSKFQVLKIEHRNLERRYEYATDKITSLKQELKLLKAEQKYNKKKENYR